MDDPRFQKSLADLDEGLNIERRRPPASSQQSPASSRQSPVGSQPSSTPTSDPPSTADRGLPTPDRGLPTADRGLPTADRQLPTVPAGGSIFPESAFTSGTASAPPLSRFARAVEARARSGSPESAPPTTDAARPLLDLFPPPPGRDRGRARAPAIVGAPPPRVARSRFGAAGRTGSAHARRTADVRAVLRPVRKALQPVHGSEVHLPQHIARSRAAGPHRRARPRRSNHAADRGSGNRKDDAVPIARRSAGTPHGHVVHHRSRRSRSTMC